MENRIKVVDNPAISMYVKLGFHLEQLLIHELMKLYEDTKTKLTKNENGENLI